MSNMKLNDFQQPERLRSVRLITDGKNPKWRDVCHSWLISNLIGVAETNRNSLRSCALFRAMQTRTHLFTVEVSTRHGKRHQDEGLVA